MPHWEMASGSARLAGIVRSWKDRVVLFAFRLPAEALFGSHVAPGPTSAFEGSGFVITSLYAPTDVARRNDAHLRRLLRGGGKSKG